MSLHQPAPTPPRDDLINAFRADRARLAALESAAPDSYSISDANDVERVRLGLQDDGSYGLRVWDSSAVLQHDLTNS